MAWYEKGLEECQAAYGNRSAGYLREKVGSPLMNVELRQRNNDCRGNAMLYQITGMLVWPFGPIDQCPTNSECWFGYLVCGNFEKEKVMKHFSSGSRPSLVQAPDFNPSWSIRSLDVTTRIIGLESLVPMISYVNITKSEAVQVEILLAQYTLTIPGDYTIEMRLQGFYPGLLHHWKPEVLRKGVEMYHSVFLGGCEGRCPPYQNCGPYNIPLCDVKSFVGNSPYRMKATHREVTCTSTAHSRDNLPFCRGGNHAGRWIRIPESVIEVCGIEKYENDLANERKRQQGKRQEFSKYSAITTAYAAHTQHLSPDKMWESVKLIDPHASTNEKIHLQILQRYSGGNICSLATVEGPLTPLDGKLELFAPYDCRYHLFSSAQAAQCFQKKGRNFITFHGDSMSRNLYAAFSDLLGVSGISPQELKELMNSGLKHFNQSAHGLTISEIYTWNGLDDSINTIHPPLYPPVYLTNVGLAHGATYNLETYWTQLTSSPIVKFWRDYSAHTSTSPPILRIYQSGSAMHGKRNVGFQWMNEVFRRQNQLHRELFLNELKFHDFDEWIITASKPDFGDGWHYSSVPLKMNSMILLNMICYID